LGGLIGFEIYKHLLFFLPSKENIDERNYRASEKVGYTRRVFAFGVDYAIVLIVSTLFIHIAGLESLIFNIVLFGYFIVSQLIFKRTIGMTLVHIRLKTEDEGQRYFSAVIIRYAMLCFVISLISLLDLMIKNSDAYSVYAIMLIVVLVVVFVDFIVGFRRGKVLLYEKLSKTRNVSTMKHKEISNSS